MSAHVSQEKIKLRLHYWNVQGRVQAIRYMLEDIAVKFPNVEYEDGFELFEQMGDLWPIHKQDKNISGTFGNLPVLHWNDTYTVCQTLPIGIFLARKFGLYGKSKSADEDPIYYESLIDGVVSCAYTDLLTNIFVILYNQVDFENSDHPYYRLVKAVAGNFKTLNDLLQTSSTPFFYDQDEPTIADYFVFYSFTLAKDFHFALLPDDDDLRALYKHEQTMKIRPALAKYFDDGRLFSRFSGSPTEDEYRAGLTEKNNKSY